MKSFKIITDSTVDLPKEYIEENDLRIVYLSYIIDDETYTGNKQLPVKEFYDKTVVPALVKKFNYFFWFWKFIKF